MHVTVLGVGAAGVKAAITAMEHGIVDRDHTKLLNTTVRDLPEKYNNEPGLYVQFSSILGGAGKESAKGMAAAIDAIKSHELDLASLINADSQEVILVSSVEGGTGSGSVPVLAQYYDAMNIPVHVFAFIGFQDEARGMNNTLRFFKNLPSKVVLHTIRNSYFLDYTKNYSIAEQAANEEFAMELEILRGSKIIPSDQNIDDTDLYKMNTTSGYMTINHIPLGGIKNVDGFNAAIASAFEDSCYMDCDHTVKRLAVLINASKDIQKVIDNKFEAVKRYIGVPFEIFQHIQYDDGDEYIDVMASGLNFPERAIKDVSDKYTKIKDKLNKGLKTFDDIFTSIEIDDDEDEFNMDVRQAVDPATVDALFGAQSIKDMARAANKIKQSKEHTINPVESPLESKPEEPKPEQVKKKEDMKYAITKNVKTVSKETEDEY